MIVTNRPKFGLFSRIGLSNSNSLKIRFEVLLLAITAHVDPFVAVWSNWEYNFRAALTWGRLLKYTVSTATR